MNQAINYKSAGEDFFTAKKLPLLLFSQGFIDERGKYREGEFRLDDGRLIEVKTDSYCFASIKPTGNIPIEIYHPRHKGRKGWYHHCIENGVSFVLFCFCNDKTFQYAVRYIMIPMGGLRIFVSAKMLDACYMEEHTRYTGGGTGNLCVPYREILRINGTRQLIPLKRITVDENGYITMYPGIDERSDSDNEQDPI